MRSLVLLTLLGCSPAGAFVDLPPTEPDPEPPVDRPDEAPAPTSIIVASSTLIDAEAGVARRHGSGFLEGAVIPPSVSVQFEGAPELGEFGCSLHLVAPGDGPWPLAELVWPQVVEIFGEEVLIEHVAVGLRPTADWEATTNCPALDLGTGPQDPAAAVVERDLVVLVTGVGIAHDAAPPSLEAYVRFDGQHIIGPRVSAYGVDETDSIKRTINGTPVVIYWSIGSDGLPVRGVYDVWVDSIALE